MTEELKQHDKQKQFVYNLLNKNQTIGLLSFLYLNGSGFAQVYYDQLYQNSFEDQQVYDRQN